jgi:uncharacterized protein (TIGR02118 family)
MVKLVGTWRIPAGADQQEIDQYYLEVHVPNVRRMPRLQRHVFGRTLVSDPGRDPVELRFAECWFATEDDLTAALNAVEPDGFTELVGNLSRTIFNVEEEWLPS